MAVSLKQFLTHLTQSGVMAEADVTAFEQSLASPPQDGEEFAKALIKHNRITRFQAQRIYQGKYKGLVLGEYVILETIGAGGIWQVFLAEHRRMGRRVALKTLAPAVAQDKTTVQRFQWEVRAAARLSHPNIVTAFDAGEVRGICYFVMEHIEGINLSDLVKHQGPLPVERAVDYVLQAAHGLEYAHRMGIIHRDIKPSNMLLNAEGTVKILDMGLARIDADPNKPAATELTQAGTVMGTVDYMAPEQALDTKHADARSDVYSLGCLLHYLLVGRSMFGGDTIVKKILAHRDEPIPSLTALRSDDCRRSPVPQLPVRP